MNKLSLSSKLILPLISGLVACALAFGGIATQVASADEGIPGTVGPTPAGLESAYQKELKAVQRQQAHLDNAQAVIGKLEERLAKQQKARAWMPRP